MAVKELKKYSWEEVSKHDQPDDCWIVVEGGVYDVTSFVDKHPGGPAILTAMAGQDATFPVRLYHEPSKFNKMIKRYQIGSIDPDTSTADADYEKAYQQAAEQGAFKTRYGFYYKIAAWCVLLLGTSIFAVSLKTLWGDIAAAVLFGLYLQQIAFIGHDLGHNAVTRNHKTDSRWGLLCGNILTGISMGWWKHTHNVHHLRTNDEIHDPDIQHLPVLAITENYLQTYYSAFHKREMKFDGFARFFVRIQHWLFLPLMSLARFNLYLQSFLYVAKPAHKNRGKEIIGLAIFWTWFSILVSYTTYPVVFVVLSHMVSGILNLQIILNHFIMPTTLRTGRDAFAEQISGTADVICPKWLDWFHGGLQFQVEHHIFPQAARHELRGLKPLVREVCEKNGLEYKEFHFTSAVGTALVRLKKMSRLMKEKKHAA